MMSLNRIALLASMAAILAGCETPKQGLNPELQVIERPPLNQENTSELGETLVERGKVYTYKAIRLENTVSAGDGYILKKLTLQPGLLTATLHDDKWRLYTTDKLAVYDAVLGTQMQLGGLAISQANEKEVKFYLNGSVLKLMTPKPSPVFTHTTVNDVDRPGFRRELIYNGRTGDSLKFLYHEDSTDLLRGPLSEEFQYDMKDGAIVGFKGVRIEVLEATNTSIRYRVLASFPDSE